MTQSLSVRARGVAPLAAVIVALVGAALAWSYQTTLAQQVHVWSSNPQYSHGWLVPGFAVLLLYLRRDRLDLAQAGPNWWGLVLLGVALLMRLPSAFFRLEWFDPLSLLPCLAGLALLLGGWTALRWCWPAVAFLFFMIELPYNLSTALALPLQRIATEASTFLLQVLGRPAVSEGTVILLNEVELGVVEACSGLRMLMVFFALSTAVALLLRKPLWEKCAVALSAVPIALSANILRITVTGVLHDTVGSEIADAVFHDLAGWLMMPVALAFLGVELFVLKHLLIQPGELFPRLSPAFRGPALAPLPPRRSRRTVTPRLAGN